MNKLLLQKDDGKDCNKKCLEIKSIFEGSLEGFIVISS